MYEHGPVILRIEVGETNEIQGLRLKSSTIQITKEELHNQIEQLRKEINQSNITSSPATEAGLSALKQSTTGFMKSNADQPIAVMETTHLSEALWLSYQQAFELLKNYIKHDVEQQRNVYWDMYIAQFENKPYFDRTWSGPAAVQWTVFEELWEQKKAQWKHLIKHMKHHVSSEKLQFTWPQTDSYQLSSAQKKLVYFAQQKIEQINQLYFQQSQLRSQVYQKTYQVHQDWIQQYKKLFVHLKELCMENMKKLMLITDKSWAQLKHIPDVPTMDSGLQWLWKTFSNFIMVRGSELDPDQSIQKQLVVFYSQAQQGDPLPLLDFMKKKVDSFFTMSQQPADRQTLFEMDNTINMYNLKRIESSQNQLKQQHEELKTLLMIQFRQRMSKLFEFSYDRLLQMSISIQTEYTKQIARIQKIYVEIDQLQRKVEQQGLALRTSEFEQRLFDCCPDLPFAFSRLDHQMSEYYTDLYQHQLISQLKILDLDFDRLFKVSH